MKLTELKIKSLGIIDDLTWEPGQGLNIITGETGAGKSLIVDSLEILFSGKATETQIRHGSDIARIEAYFIGVNNAPAQLQKLLSDKQLDIEDDSLVVEVELKKSGRNIFRINSTPVTRSYLEQVGSSILDVHSQNQHLSLFDRSTHLDVLDVYAGIQTQKTLFASQYHELKRLQQEKIRLAGQAQEYERQRGYLTFQIEEIEKASLKPGEDRQLADELNKLANAETLHDLSCRLYQVVREGMADDGSVYDRLAKALKLMDELCRYDQALVTINNCLYEVFEVLNDIGQQIRRYSEEIETSPERLEEVQNRLELLNSIKRKYGTVEEAIQHKMILAQQLQSIENNALDLAEVDRKIAWLRKDMAEKALRLSNSRKIAATRLENEVAGQIEELEMKGVCFQVRITYQPDENGLLLADTKVAFDASGIDRVGFLVSTNPGEPLKPVEQVASTGEASRFTLALKNALAEADSIPMQVYDEIDIGVGGRNGEVIGRKLWRLGNGRQVVCITHLAQIAAFADCHFRVVKAAIGERNTASIHWLNDEARLEELAIMLSSKQYSVRAREVARELMTSADKWKQQFQQ